MQDEFKRGGAAARSSAESRRTSKDAASPAHSWSDAEARADEKDPEDLDLTLDDRELLDTFDNEDFLPHEPGPRPAWTRPRWRLWPWARRRDDTEAATYASLDRPGHERRAPGGRDGRFSRALRAIYNYPEADMKLRSTAWLDGLRGLAAFEVFIFHYNQEWVDEGLTWGPGGDDYSDPAWWRAPFLRTFYCSGSSAVLVFFAISGYVLSQRVLSMYRQQRHAEAYAALSSAVVRRALRLYLPVIGLSGALMLICRLLPFVPKATGYGPADTFLGEINNWLGVMTGMLPPLRYPDRWYELVDPYGGGVSWTIPLEYYGSIVVFIALLFVATVRNFAIRCGLLAAMVAQSLIKDDWTAAQFLLGMMFADYQLQTAAAREAAAARPFARRLLREVLAILLFLFGFYLAGMPSEHEADASLDPDGPAHAYKPRPGFDWVVAPLIWLGVYDNHPGDRYVECLSGLTLVVGMGESALLRGLLERRPVQWLGRISFGLYLTHVPLRASLHRLDRYYLLLFGLDPAVPRVERTASLAFFGAYVVRMIPVTAIVLLVGGLFERFVDRPSVTFGRTFERLCQAGAPAAAEAAYAPLPQHHAPRPAIPLQALPPREDEQPRP